MGSGSQTTVSERFLLRRRILFIWGTWSALSGVCVLFKIMVITLALNVLCGGTWERLWFQALLWARSWLSAFHPFSLKSYNTKGARIASLRGYPNLEWWSGSSIARKHGTADLNASWFNSPTPLFSVKSMCFLEEQALHGMISPRRDQMKGITSQKEG